MNVTDPIHLRAMADAVEACAISPETAGKLLREAAEEIARLCRWIPVSESRPTTSGIVAVRNADGEYAFDSYKSGKWEHLCEDMLDPVEWHPLPQSTKLQCGDGSGS